MARIIGFAGAAGSGKDLAASMIPLAHRIAFADPIYEGLEAMLGIPEALLRDRDRKEVPTHFGGLSPRQLLQTLGTEWGRGVVTDDIWIKVAVERWKKASALGVQIIVVPDVRFANEADTIRAFGGEVWMIYRPDVQPVAPHSSEAGIPLRCIDRLIVNSGTVKDFRIRVLDTLLNSKSRATAA